jgi:hypothetical protein
MAKTLHSKPLDVGASEKTIQFLLKYSQSLEALRLKDAPEELELFPKN